MASEEKAGDVSDVRVETMAPANTDPAPPYEASSGVKLEPMTEVDVEAGDSPPTYDSLFGKMKAAKENSEGVKDLASNMYAIIFGSIGCTIMIVIVLGIPLSMLIMGSVYLDSCPLERYIPIYLIVAGVFSVVQAILNMVCGCVRKDEEGNKKANPCDGLLSCFMLCWFIAGNVWIYRTFPKFDPTLEDITDPNYCHPTLFYFAFWITTAGYIVMALLCVCGCACCCIAGLCSKKNE